MDLITFTAAAAAAQTAAAASGGDEAVGVAERTDEHFANTVLLLHGDGNPGANNVNNPAPEAQYMALSDDSPNDRQVIRFGSNVYGTDFNPFYYNNGSFSNSFDGTSSGAVTITPTDDRTDLSGPVDFTIRFWIFPRTVGQSSFSEIFSRGRGSTYSGYRVGMPNGESTIYFGINYASSTIGASFSKSSALPLNEWTHVAITREANTMKIYLNGVLDATNTGFTGNPSMASNDVIYLGRGSYDSSNRQFNGLLNSFELIKGRNLYSADFTPPTAPTEDPTTHGELSVYLDGSSDWLDVPTSLDHDFGTGDFTVEFWVYPNEALGFHVFLTAPQNTTTQIGYDTGNGPRYLYFYNGANVITGTGAGSLVAFAWNHVALVREGTTLSLFSNGSRVGTATHSSSVSFSNLNIGRYHAGGYDMNSYMSNIKLVKGNAIYDPSNTTYTIPTSPLTADANTTFLGCHGKTFQDYSNSNHSIARSGNAHISEFGPFGDGYWSNYFDGDSDSLEIANSTDFKFGTGDFTIECWLYPTVATQQSYGIVVKCADNSNWYGGWAIAFQNSPNNGKTSFWVNNSQLIGSGTALNQNQWNHIAVTRSGSTTNLYQNGSRVATATNSYDFQPTAVLTIASDILHTAYEYQGYIKDLRILKGTALYTGTSYTQPTTNLDKITNTVLLTCQSNRFIDNSDSAHSISVGAGTPQVSELIPFEYLKRQTKLITCQENRFKDIINYRWLQTPSTGAKVSTASPFSDASYKTANTGAIYMDGSSFVTVDDQAESFKFGTEDYTMELWVYDTSTDTTQRTIFGRNGTGNLAIPYVYKLPTSEVFGLYYSSVITSTTRKIYKGEWTHLALCRENGTSRLFINGELQSSGSDTTNIVSNVKLVIGNNGGSSSNLGWNGYIYGARVEKGRARYTSNASFKPASTQPSLANSANTGVISTNEFSNFFDGNDSLANTNILSVNDFTFGHNDWTMEGWVRKFGKTTQTYFEGRQVSVQGFYPVPFTSTDGRVALWYNNGQRISSRVLETGQWYHWAFVRSGGKIQLYLNGLKEAATYDDTNYDLCQVAVIGRNHTPGYYLYGNMHSLNLLNGVAKYTSNTAITYSPVSKIGTANTNGSFSRYIPGINTKIAIPTTGLPTGSQPRTMEFWAKVTEYGTQSTQYMVAYGVNSGSQVYSIGLTSGGAIRVVGYSNDYSTSVVVPKKTWFHLSVNYDGTYNTIFLNGMMIDRRTFSINTGSHTHLYVNSEANGSAGTYVHRQGFQICDLAVYNVAIRSAVSTSGFIPPTSATTIASNNNIVLLGCQSNTDIELASGEFKGGYDQSAISSETPFDNGYWSVYFDGSDYLTFPSSTDFVPGTGEFCLEFWFNGVSAGWLVGNRSGGYHPIATYLDLSNSRIIVWMSSNGGSWNIINDHYVTGVSSGQWHHFALVRDSSNNIIRYLDGSGTTITTSSASFTSAQNFYVGGSPEGGLDMAGHISNLRFVKGSSVYTGSFTPSTEPLTAITDTKILTCQSGAFLDNSTANSGLGYSITLSGDPIVSRSRPFSTELSRDQVLLACQDKEVQKDNSHLDTKFTRTGDVTRSADNPFNDGLWSGQFDGNGDEIASPEDVIDLNTSSFTAELWFKQKGNGSYSDTVGNTLLIIGASSTSNAMWITITNAGLIKGWIRYNGSSWELTLTGPTIPLSTWNHVALVKNTDDSNSIKLFVNGSLVASGTNSTDLTSFGQKVGIGSQVGAGRDFNGFISNVRVVVGSALYTSDFTPSTSPFTTTSQGATASEVKLLTCQSSNFVDNSGSKIKLEAAGNANTRPVFPDTFANTIPQQTTLLAGKYPGSVRNIGFLDESSNNTTVVSQNQVTQGSFTPHYPPSGYWSIYFTNGTDQGVTFNDSNNDLDLGGVDAHLEFWYNPSSLALQVLAGKHGGSSNWSGSGFEYQVFLQSNVIKFNYNVGGSAGTIASTTSLTLGKWYHVAVATDILNNIAIFIDGVREATGTNGITKPAARTNFKIGSDIGGNDTDGFISNLRHVTGSNAYDPTASSITLPTDYLTAITGTQILTARSNRFEDLSANDLSVSSLSSTPKVKPYFPFSLTTSYDPYDHGGSAYFDGGDDRLSLPLSAFTNLLGNDFTFECWYYGETSSNANKTLFSQGSGYSPFSVYHYGDGIRYNLSTGGSWTKQDTSTYGSDGFINQWNHVAISRSGSNFAAFLNGTRVDNYTNAITLMTPTESTHIGARNGNDFDYKGYVSSWRLVIDEAIYDPTQTTLTLPTSPFRNTANTRALLNFTNAGIYDSTAKNNFLIYGDAQISTGAANTKFGTGSIFFDQAESVRATGSGIPIGTGPFTIEMFAKINNTAHNPSLLRIAGGSFVLQYYGGEFEVGNEPTPAIQVAYTVVPDRWYHVAVTRDDSNNLRLFVDGRHLKTSTNYTTNFTDADYFLGNLYSTGGSSRTLKGFLDEVRITVGQARYTTANFTPMTAASGNKSS